MLRLIDANFNRLSEGLRLLEDIARFMLNDIELSSRLKAMRHDILPSDPAFRRKLLNDRNSDGDVAAFAGDDMSRADLPSIASANAHRATESLRALEELAKLPEIELDPMKFKEARFAIYEIEREMFGRLTRRSRQIAGLYLIIDRDLLREKDEIDVCRRAINGGAKAIQLRDKSGTKERVLSSAQRLSEECASRRIPFIVNDQVDIAMASRSTGVHLGQDDLPVSTTRRLLPIDMLIGCSTETAEQALKAESDGADYIAVGSIFPTTSKSDADVVGLERLRQIREAVSLPIVAIGGINAENARSAIDAGADAVAVISAILGSDDIESAARKIVERLEAE